MKKGKKCLQAVYFCVAAAALALAMSACGGGGSTASTQESTVPEETGPQAVTESTYFKVDGLYLDKSYKDEDKSSMRMVYLFGTIATSDQNLEYDSKYCTMTVDDVNTYESDHYASSATAAEWAKSYYYGNYIQDLYTGDTAKVMYTFLVPKGDLTAGKKLTFSDSQIPDMEQLELYTDNIVTCKNGKVIAQKADPKGYKKAKKARASANGTKTSKVRNAINGYYWNFYVNSLSYKIEFYAPNKYELTTGLGTTTGKYVVCNGYVKTTNDSTGAVNWIPYSFDGGEIDLDVTAGFDVSESS